MKAAARITLEITAESLEDALTAQRGGADRLELCADLARDGLTPSLELFRAVRAHVPLPIMAMIRPRAGDFCYSTGEIDRMAADVDEFVAAGAEGLVFGALRDDRTINVAACREMLAHCAGRQTIFHRAFDSVSDTFAALDTLIDLGFTRVLTSGQRASADDPAALGLLGQLVAHAAGRIEILPGGGVRPHNAAAILRATGATQLHSSCRCSADSAAGVDERSVTALRREACCR